MTPMRVLLVDDHPVVREGLRSMLTGESVEVVAEASRGADALGMCLAHAPDVVLLDMQLPDMDGVAVLRQIKASTSRAAVLVLSMHDDPALVRKAIDAGASGYVLKGISRGGLLASMRAVCDGASVFDPALLRAEAPPPRASGSEALTAVEHEVLRHLAEGMTNREISTHMRWSVATAKKYVQRIFEKLQVTDRTQAVANAIRRGWLE